MTVKYCEPMIDFETRAIDRDVLSDVIDITLQRELESRCCDDEQDREAIADVLSMRIADYLVSQLAEQEGA